MGDFPIGEKDAFADGKVDAAFGELADFLGVAVEAVDNPGLGGTVFFMEPQDVGSGSDVVDDEGLLMGFGKEDMPLEDFHLEVVGRRVGAVEAGLADGGRLGGQGKVTLPY